MVDDAQGFRERMACLADESRFRIVLALAGTEQCVSHLARAVGLSQSCTSRHLQALARRGLVHGDRRGRQVVFALRFDSPEIRVVLRAFDPAAVHGDLADVAAPAKDARSRAGKAPSIRPATRRTPAATPEPVALDLNHKEASDLGDPADNGSDSPVQGSYRRNDLEDYLL